MATAFQPLATRNLEAHIEDRSAFVAAMGSVANSVTVVTTNGSAGRFGQTVSSFCSVSADPPLMLCCINTRSPMCDALEQNEYFNINVLSDAQAHIADRFAGRPQNGKPFDFDAVDWSADLQDCPVINNACATFSCVLEKKIVGNSHYIYLGRVVATQGTDNPPLGYRNRNYGQHASFL